MTFKIFIVLLLITLPLFAIVNAQSIDTVKHTEKTIQTGTSTTINDNNSPEDDFSPGMLFFALVGIGLIFICIGIGIVLAAMALLVIFGLIATGILSASVIVGLNKKSFAKGFKTFLLLSGSIGGLGIGIGALYLINSFFHLQLTTTSSVLAGGISGLLGGLLLGLLIYTTITKVSTYFIRRLQIAS